MPCTRAAGGPRLLESRRQPRSGGRCIGCRRGTSASPSRGPLQLTILALLTATAEAWITTYTYESSNAVGYDVGSNAGPMCADMDSDGDVDCLVGNSDGYVRFYENRPTASNPYAFTQTFTNFFSTDVGSWAKPWCGDLDNDGKIDCLVGESTGRIRHFRRDAFVWTYANADFFSYDFGSYPVPFCADMDNDGLIDCLIGESNGRVYFMRRTSSSLSGFTRQSQFYFGQLEFGSHAAPTCADLDRDGVVECFVGNWDGYVSYLRQTGNDNWVKESDNIFNRDFGSYAVPTCADIDGDGVIDVLVGESTGYVRLMQRKSRVRFSYEGSILTDVGSNAVPMCVDMDKDGDLDVVVGDNGGYVEFFRNQGTNPSLSFSRVSTNYLGSVAGTFAAPSCFDTDGDGDIDCLLGTSNGNVHHYRKGSSSYSQVSNNYMPFDVGSYAVPFCVDMDGDGDVDCLVGADNGVVWYFRKSGSSYTRASNNFFNYDIGSYAAPACLDLDRDGRLDCLVGENGGMVYHFRNDGTNTSFNWKLVSSNYFSRDFGTRAALSCADIDNDGAIDCLVGNSGGTVSHMRQRDLRGPAFTKEYNMYFSDAGSNARPYCTDLDQDGLIDCLIGNSDGYLQYYRNSGSASSPSWSRQSTNFFNSDVGSDASPFCYDIDNDGDMDCLVGNSLGTVYHFRNDRFSWTRQSTNFFSRDVGSNAAPFCIDMDGDGDMDCLVGNSAGQVYYFRRSGSSWTYASSNYFNYDVGSDAVPFCADLDGDGDVDCLVGAYDGLLYHFRNVGTRTSARWVLTTRNYLDFDTGTANAPFCWDMDNDGDFDCFVGDSNGDVYTYKNHQTSAGSGRSTTTPAPLPGTCHAGSYWNSGSCVQCPAGRYDTGSNPSSVSTCALCPPCTSSFAGSADCKLLSSCWLSTVNGTSVGLTINHNGGGLLRLRFTMPPLPLPSTIHGNHEFGYSADLQRTVAQLSFNSTCGNLWSTRTTEMEVALLFPQLTTMCTVTRTILATDVRFNGHAAILVRLVSDDNRVLRTISFPFEIRLPREVIAMYSLAASRPIEMPKRFETVAAYNASLRAYSTVNFAREVAVPVFQDGQTIFIQQSSSVGQDWRLSLRNAWISTTADHRDINSVHTNLTTLVTNHQAAADTVRFSFAATSCQDCFLHVISVLNSRSRRLSTNLNLAHASMALTVLSKAASGDVELRGELDLAVSNSSVFVADPRAQHGVAIGLRQLLGLPPTIPVVVGLSELTTRLRRLQTAQLVVPTVQATYVIMLPAAGTGNQDPNIVEGTLMRATPGSLTQSIRSGLSVATGGTGASPSPWDLTVKTVSTLTRSSPTGGTPPPSSTQPPTGATPPPITMQPGDDPGFPVAVAIGAGAGVPGLALMCCFAVLFYRRCRKPKPETPKQDNKKDTSDSNDVTAKPTLDLVKDPVLLGELQKLFVPPPETRDTMGIGRDVGPRTTRWTKLNIKHVWAVTPSPTKRDLYKMKKKDVSTNIYNIDKACGEATIVKRTAPMEVMTDEVGKSWKMNEKVNEKLLLHGTKVGLIPTIIANGIDSSYTTVAAFGNGAYFAEDPSKSDQYVEVDSSSPTNPEIKSLHQELYEANKIPHPGNVYYAFVCQVILGCPLYTKGPGCRKGDPGHPKSAIGPTQSTVAGEEGQDVYPNENRQILIGIPGTSPSIPYHSLVVLKGPPPEYAVARHREFLIFDKNAALPKYLVAYTRDP